MNTTLIQKNVILRLTLLDIQEMNLDTSAYAVTILRRRWYQFSGWFFLISTSEQVFSISQDVIQYKKLENSITWVHASLLLMKWNDCLQKWLQNKMVFTHISKQQKLMNYWHLTLTGITPGPQHRPPTSWPPWPSTWPPISDQLVHIRNN